MRARHHEEEPLLAQRRRARRVVYRIDPWSVLRFAALFWLSLVTVIVLASVILWLAATSVNVIDNFEGFMESIGFEQFELLPGRMLRAAIVGGLLFAALGTFASVLMAVLYNLISDLVGGIRVNVIEDELPARRQPAQRPKPNGKAQTADRARREVV